METYLVLYGADNECWMCEADTAQNAVEQFHDADPDAMGGEINGIMICVPVDVRGLG